jgi:glycine/D-amino acid oxidase-like deaminating enzyme
MTPIIVVGAGCFGAWTAYRLARSGHAVTLLDAYGPGNSRASSGGETRVIRMGYGAQQIYTQASTSRGSSPRAVRSTNASPSR